ncbi:MAG: hypothetical protein AAGE94_25325, partial [Acidobacteriota bacterium]
TGARDRRIACDLHPVPTFPSDISITRVAWFASVPPATDPVAELNARVLPALAERVEVHLFTAADDVDPEITSHATIHPALGNPDLWPTVQACDLAFFHLDRTASLHGDVFDLCCQHPGIVVFHDPSLHELVAWSWVLYQSRVEHYLRAVDHEHGRAGRELAARWQRGELDFAEIALRLPMTSWIGRRALGVVALDRPTAEPLRTEVLAGRLGPLTLAERDLPADEWVDRVLDLAVAARGRRVESAVRTATDRTIERWSWLPRRLRRRAVDRLTDDFAQLVRLAGEGRDLGSR